MLAFGLNKKLCSDFLKKQAVIGNLDEGELSKGYHGEVGARATPLTLPEEGSCHGNLFPWLTFFPRYMERILWLCSWKLFLVRDGK